MHQSAGCGRGIARAFLRVVGSVVVGVALASTTQVQADEPSTSSPTAATPQITPNRPDGPPPEAINCVRPDTTKHQDQLSPDGSLEVQIESATGNILVSIVRVPAEATCYAVYRQPSGSNPVLFQYGPAPLDVPRSQPDPLKPAVAGNYCYTLIFGSPRGSSAPYERCVDLPASIAPTPTPVPEFVRPPAPVTGPPATGNTEPSGRAGYSITPFGIALAGLVLAGLGAHGLRRKRFRPQ